MKLRNLLLPALVALTLVAAPGAHADTYLMVGGSLAKISDVDIDNTDNIGYFGEAGWTNGTFAIGAEVSNHMHLGNETLAGAVNARVFLGDWVVKPYISAGAGATFEGDPLAQAGAGLMWTANDEGEAGSFGIYAGYEHRFYFDGFDSFDSTGDDGYAKIGLMLTF